MIKQNKGNIAITLLVFMVLALVLAAWIGFIYNSRGVNEKLTDARILRKGFLGEQRLSFYLKTGGEKAFAESYSSVIDSKSSGTVNLAGQKPVLGFDKFFEDLSDASLNEKAKQYLIEETESYDFQDNFLKKFQAQVRSEKLSTSVSDEIMKIKIREIALFDVLSVEKTGKTWGMILSFFGFRPEARIDTLMDFAYWPKINVELNLSQMGLNSLGKIREASFFCNNKAVSLFSEPEAIDEQVAELKKCLGENLQNFNAEAEKYGSGNLVTLTSKRKFLVNNEFKNIKIEFLT